jgi:hypothetical protein
MCRKGSTRTLSTLQPVAAVCELQALLMLCLCCQQIVSSTVQKSSRLIVVERLCCLRPPVVCNSNIDADGYSTVIACLQVNGHLHSRICCQDTI